MIDDSVTAKADIERAYHHYCQDTWDALSDMYEDITGNLPDIEFDLLKWFVINYEFMDGAWVYIKHKIN